MYACSCARHHVGTLVGRLFYNVCKCAVLVADGTVVNRWQSVQRRRAQHDWYHQCAICDCALHWQLLRQTAAGRHWQQTTRCHWQRGCHCQRRSPIPNLTNGTDTKQ